MDASIASGNRDLYIRHFADYAGRVGPSFTYEVSDGVMTYTSYLSGSYGNYLTILYGNLPESMRLNNNLNPYKERGGLRVHLEQLAPDFEVKASMTVNANSGSYHITKRFDHSTTIDLPFFNFLPPNYSELPDGPGYNPSVPMPDLSVLYYFNITFAVQDGLEPAERTLKVDSISVVHDLFDGERIIFSNWSPLEGGVVTGGGVTTGSLEAVPAKGYLFQDWSAPYSGNPNPIVFDTPLAEDLILTATFIKDSNDDDKDGLSNYYELVVFNTDKDDADSDDDGVSDGLEASLSGLGFNANVDDDFRMNALAANVNEISTLLKEVTGDQSLERFRTDGLTIGREEDGTYTVLFQPQYLDTDTLEWVDHGDPVIWNSPASSDGSRLMRFKLSQDHIKDVEGDF